MVNYFSESLHWGHGKESFAHEHSGANSCWNWEVQKLLSRECSSAVNAYMSSGQTAEAKAAMIECFVSSASASHKVCSRELDQFRRGKSDILALDRCGRKEIGLAMRNLLQTSLAVGECRPIP